MPDITDAWDDIDPTLPLHVRMDKLELMMRAWRDEQTATENLTESVQRLTTLGKELSRVEKQSATKNEVEKAAEALAEETKRKTDQLVRERRRLTLRILSALAATAAVLFGLVLYVSTASHDACERRHAASRAVLDTLMSFQDAKNPNPNITMGAERIAATLAVSCDEQYRLHLG